MNGTNTLAGAEFVLKLMAAWELEFHDLFKDTPPKPRRLQASEKRLASSQRMKVPA
ncbi:hypothetical protein [Rhodococcus qingshengii]|uniref:hypothetical protein n=1 Tax=Rhodococcus qingshengii TaxID=334542 RepID=UPI0013150756|nr:hypothetical protein [Rhodococcus qingshengii]